MDFCRGCEPRLLPLVREVQGPAALATPAPLGSEMRDTLGTGSSGSSVGLHWWSPSSLGVTVMRPEGRRGARARAEPGVPGGEVAKGEQRRPFNLRMESGARQFLSPSNVTGAARVFASLGPSLPS